MDSEEEAELDPESNYQSKMGMIALAKPFGGASLNRKQWEYLRNIQSVALPPLHFQSWITISREHLARSYQRGWCSASRATSHSLSNLCPTSQLLVAPEWARVHREDWRVDSGKSDIIGVIQDTLVLISNASSYISQARCTTVINSISQSSPSLVPSWNRFVRRIWETPEMRRSCSEQAQ